MREFILRKIDHCIECESCIKACKKRHTKPRMTLEGKKFDCSSVPDVCKFCSDPACVQACRKDAMKKVSDRVYVDTDKCVGCGLCAKACPYDAITIIDRTELEPKKFFKRKQEEPKKKKRAFKCDLCLGFKNSACIDACPTNALQRLEVDTYKGESCEDIVEFLKNPPEKPKKSGKF